jgi:hypothetical protein
MPTSATLLNLSPNCKNADFYLSGGAMSPNNNSGGTVYINVYLTDTTTGLGTQVYQGDPDVDANFDGSINFNVSSLTSSTNMLYDNDDAELDAIIESITSFNGLFSFEFISNDGEVDYTASTYTLGTCAIDCCMANLLGTVINCGCGEDECHDVIRKIEKILILIRCAVVDAANGDIAAAQLKYNKAAELCDLTCDCNC